MTTSWNGTQLENRSLTQVLNRYCTCEFGSMGLRLTCCGPHQMLEDQRALDGLVFGRRIAAKLQGEEWLMSAPTPVLNAR